MVNNLRCPLWYDWLELATSGRFLIVWRPNEAPLLYVSAATCRPRWVWIMLRSHKSVMFCLSVSNRSAGNMLITHTARAQQYISAIYNAGATRAQNFPHLNRRWWGFLRKAVMCFTRFLKTPSVWWRGSVPTRVGKILLYYIDIL